MALALLGTEGWNVEEKCLGIKLEEEEQEDVVNDEKLLREFLLNVSCYIIVVFGI